MAKQLLTQDFIRRNNIDILHCQEINIEEDSFANCDYINSNFNIFPNNAINQYGTATLVKDSFKVENFQTDTEGRGIKMDIGGLTLGNFYLHSGTDALSRNKRETFCSETIPQLLTNRKGSGEVGGDWNCILSNEDCTKYPEAKKSPCLKRVVNLFNMTDSFRYLHPGDEVFSRYYGRAGQEGATRIDRSYHWGEVRPVEAKYQSVAFSDHLAYIVEI